MIKRIIFFIEFPFNQRDYERFGIEILQENGFEVEVWDFTPFLHPQVYQDVKMPDPINWGNFFTFLKSKEAQSSILRLAHDCFILCILSYQYKSFAIYQALSKSKLPYCVLMVNALPSVNNKKILLKKFKRIKKLDLSKIIDALFTRIPYSYLGIRPATMSLAGGAKSINYNYPVSKKTETLWLHSLDYDIYLKENQNPIQTDNKKGVFLDEYMPFHPDYIHLGLPVPATPEDYYPIVCKFFDFIESRCGVDIIIAAHPSSNYEEHPDYFDGRPVIRGKTVELVRKSRFTIAHSSTSINFAVLLHKPVIFITTNRLKQTWDGPIIELMASQLGKKPINIDDPLSFINFEKELSINEKAYMNYRHSYIKKMGSDELPFWQIFADRIRRYND